MKLNKYEGLAVAVSLIVVGRLLVALFKMMTGAAG
jgi:hypothetical protein